jgi:hypothetical protein
LIAILVATPPRMVSAGMVNVHAWATLSELIGQRMAPADLIARVRALHREETVFKLARFAAVLANARGSVLGPEARAWTRDLLVQGRESPNHLEAAVGAALARLPLDRAVGHAHVVFLLQLMAVAYASPTGNIPSDGYLSFLMLAANEHIPEWVPSDKAVLTSVERVLGVSFFCTTFNQSDDMMRSLLRIVDLAGHRSERDFPDARTWEQIQHEAFGTSFEEYVDLFLTPMYIISKSWDGDSRPPVTMLEQWRGSDDRERALYERWLREASMTFEEAATAFAGRQMASGLLGLTTEFFRKPFIQSGHHLVCLSPWHMRDHVVFGTWGKLNEASKKVLGTSSNQVFSSAFGYNFERWCGSLATEASSSDAFRDELILPSAPGAEDEIEDVVVCEGNYVALFSAKASLVRETSLKTANYVEDTVAWLRRFFFEEGEGAKPRGYRAGAALLLDAKIQRLRAGDYEDRGLRRDAVLLPCIISFDNVGESGALYRWLGEECARRGILSARPDVRPLTVLTPEDYEGLIALSAEGLGICQLLAEKTEPDRAEGRLDQFLYDRAPGQKLMRLPSMRPRFERMGERSIERMRLAMGALEADRALQQAGAGAEQSRPGLREE